MRTLDSAEEIQLIYSMPILTNGIENIILIIGGKDNLSPTLFHERSTTMKRLRHILAVIMAFMYCFCYFSVISAKASTDEFTIRDGVLKKYSGSGGAVVIPDGVKIIDREAFYKCSTLTSVVIPESVTKIRARAFQGTSLTSISIPATVDGIYEFSLSINTLTSIEVDPENQVYSSSDGVLYTKDRTALLVYPRNKPNTSYEVPKGVTRIANWAYYEGNLKSISLPDTIKSIGEGAFFNGGIQTVYYEGSKEDWNKINIRTANSGLIKAEIRYNSYQTDSLSKAEAFQIKERVPVMDFTDVPSSAWYSESIKLVCEHHIMNGIGKTTFLPNGTLTIGEAIAIASRLHDSYYGNNTVFQSGTPWYQPYVDYARRCGIINGEYQYNMTVSRAEFALFIGNSLSDEMLAPINKVEIGDIPDVYYLIPSQDVFHALSKAGVIGPNDSENSFSLLMILRKATDNGASSTDLSDAIHKLYRAGIIAENDEYGTFTPRHVVQQPQF